MVTYLIGIPYTILLFVMFGLATYFCIPLGVAVCGVILSRDIHPRTKAVVAVVGAISYISLVRWQRRPSFFDRSFEFSQDGLGRVKDSGIKVISS